MKKINKLNLGSGNDYKKGFYNIDYCKKHNPDKVADLNKGLPFIKSNSIEYIYTSNFLEHLLPDAYIPFLNEMYRVSKHNCIWEIIVPFDNSGGRCNPFHYRTFYFSYWRQFQPQRTHNETNIVLVQLNKPPNIFLRFIYQVFPFLCNQIKFELLVVKNWR